MCPFVCKTTHKLLNGVDNFRGTVGHQPLSHTGGLVAQRLGRWIQDRKVHGSIPSRCTAK